MIELPGAYALDLVEIVKRWGVDSDALLQGSGVTVDALRDPSVRLPLATCAAILERAERLTGEPALAMHMGLEMRVSSHGFLGFAAMTSSTIGEALELAERFCQTRTTAIALTTYVEGERASLVLEEREPLDGMREFIAITLLVGIAEIGRALTREPLDGTLEFAFAARESFAPFEALAPGRVRFSQPANRLVFASSLLATKIVSADAVATQLARAQCERELAALADAGSFPGQVRKALAHGGENGGSTRASGDQALGPHASIDDAARRLHVSVRTLKRRLTEHGTTFSQVREGLLHQRSLLLLEQRGLSIGEIADRLGYSDIANFTRAFRRWTGKSPVAFRKLRTPNEPRSA